KLFVHVSKSRHGIQTTASDDANLCLLQTLMLPSVNAGRYRRPSRSISLQRIRVDGTKGSEHVRNGKRQLLMRYRRLLHWTFWLHVHNAVPAIACEIEIKPFANKNTCTGERYQDAAFV